MATFIASMSYELHPGTAPDAAKLLRAELVGRRWLERCNGPLLPAHTVWMQRKAPDDQTTDDVHDACSQELLAAVAAVASARAAGSRSSRAFVQVAGAGTYGLVKLDKAETRHPASWAVLPRAESGNGWSRFRDSSSRVRSTTAAGRLTRRASASNRSRVARPRLRPVRCGLRIRRLRPRLPAAAGTCVENP